MNPAPVAQIAQPTAGQIFSPGTVVTVDVTATDLTVGGGAGTVTQVELFDNDVSLGIDTTAVGVPAAGVGRRLRCARSNIWTSSSSSNCRMSMLIADCVTFSASAA